LVAKPGFAVSTGLLLAAYSINLLSGLILAEVAIKQHEAAAQSGQADPSSFRQLAAISLDSEQCANGVGGLSLFVNTCALTFSLGRAGDMFADLNNGGNPEVLRLAFAAALGLLGATQSRVRISQLSAVFLTALFVSVAGLIGPGLGAVDHVAGTLLAPGTSPDVATGVREAAPIMLTTLIFQNIVPPVTKILGYDRTKSAVALVMGSFLPLALYLSWSFVVLGGGVDTNVGMDSPLMTVFSVAALTGSSIGCTMAVSEELQAFIGSGEDESQGPPAASAATRDAEGDKDTGYALPAVLAAILVPLACTTLCHEYTDALKISGGYGIPVLYGAIPVVMAWTQREKLRGHTDLIPGGTPSLGLVAAAFSVFMMNSAVGDVQSISGSL
jgi:tyrosine-specific transport protein